MDTTHVKTLARARDGGRIAACLTAVALVLASCSKPTLDTTTPQTIKTSLERMRKGMPEEKQKTLGESIVILSLGPVGKGPGGATALAEKAPDQISGEALRPLHGKTADEIIAAAERVLAERRAKERGQALAEIEELEVAKKAAEAARVELARFEVLKSRFSQTKDFLGRNPLLELSVQNGTAHTVSRVFFRGTLASLGRALPWLKEDFNYEIRGGLQPGESASWSQTPNRFGAWGQVDAPKDAIFTVEVVKLLGADEKVLFDADFPAAKEERLAMLRKEYQEAAP